MASERVKSILREKGAPFDDDQLEAMSDAEGWRWIYASRGAGRVKGPKVCFTGFPEQRRFELEDLARGIGLTVVQSVVQDLEILVTGPSAGPAKLERAVWIGALVLSEGDFVEEHVKPSLAARLSGTSTGPHSFERELVEGSAPHVSSGARGKSARTEEPSTGALLGAGCVTVLIVLGAGYWAFQACVDWWEGAPATEAEPAPASSEATSK